MNAHVKPTTAQPCLPPPVGIPRKRHHRNPTLRARKDAHPLAHLKRLRDEAAAEVERLLAFLDETDGCEDHEPSLGYPEPDISLPTGRFQGTTRTDEGDQSDQRGFGCTDDREAALPVPIEYVDRFGDTFQDDFEGDDEEREGDGGVDDEPSLGFSEPVITGDEGNGWWWAYKSKDAAQHDTTPAECTDCEGDEHDGREDGHDAEDDRSDFEPSLGAHSTDERSQEHWAQGDREDREGPRLRHGAEPVRNR